MSWKSVLRARRRHAASRAVVLLGTVVVVHPDDAADALPLGEQVERAVYLLETHLVRDELVQLQLLEKMHVIPLQAITIRHAWIDDDGAHS